MSLPSGMIEFAGAFAGGAVASWIQQTRAFRKLRERMAEVAAGAARAAVDAHEDRCIARRFPAAGYAANNVED